MRANFSTPVLILAIAGLLAACSKGPPNPPPDAAPAAPSTAAIKTVAGVQDIMNYMVDPAADFLWESVSTTETAEGIEEKQPRTDEEWREVHKHAILLTEGANLLLIDRHVAGEGRSLEDHGTPGNLTAAESEEAIARDRQTYVAFALALRDVGEAFVAAADNRDPKAIVDAGDTMDQVCEGCHLKFWYPGQKIPAFPDQAPEEK
jgi:predicted small lipoprotein YifL